MNANGSFKPNECEIQLDGNLLCDGNLTLVVDVNGEKPSSGTITFKEGKIDNITISVSGKDVTKNSNGELVLNDKNEEVKLESGLYYENDKLLYSWDDWESKLKNELGRNII